MTTATAITTIDSTVVASTVSVPATTAEKTFTVAGVSCLKGVYKLRVANGIDRVKVLHKNDHTDIRLIELPNAMTKMEAVQYLMDLPNNTDIDDDVLKNYFTDLDAQQAFDDFLASKAPKPPKPAKAPKEPKVKKAVAAAPVTVQELLDAEIEETPVDLTSLYESVGLDAPTVYDDATEEVDTEDQPF